MALPLAQQVVLQLLQPFRLEVEAVLQAGDNGHLRLYSVPSHLVGRERFLAVDGEQGGLRESVRHE